MFVYWGFNVVEKEDKWIIKTCCQWASTDYNVFKKDFKIEVIDNRTYEPFEPENWDLYISYEDIKNKFAGDIVLNHWIKPHIKINKIKWVKELNDIILSFV